MKILFVHEVSWFKKVVYEMHDFPELLSLRGHEVRFLDYDEGAPRTRFRTRTTPESRGHSGSRVYVTTPPRLLPGVLGRLLATFLQPLSFLLLLRQTTPHVVVSYSVPTSGWQIAAICRFKRVPYVARIIDVPHALRPTLFRPLVKWSERVTFRLSSLILTHNEVLRQYCLGQGASSEKTKVVYPGVDSRRFFPAPPDPQLQDRYGIVPSDKVIVFMGTLFSFSGLNELVEELSHQLKANRQIKFLILGEGEQFQQLIETTRKFQLEAQVILAGRIEYEQLADHLRLGHVAMLPFKLNLVTHGALPNKVLQYLASGLPVVCTSLRGLQSVLPNGEGVMYVNDLREMATVTVDLLANLELRRHVSEVGLNAMRQLCDWNTQIIEVERILESVVNAR